MKPKLNVNFTLVFSDGYTVTMTYNELQEVYKLLKLIGYYRRITNEQ